jgi:glucose/arabinose dehydrogenase
MKRKHLLFGSLAATTLIGGTACVAASAPAPTGGFHDAPTGTTQLKNPYHVGDAAAVKNGARLFSANCAGCHGKEAMGSGNVPNLAHGPAQSASEGELFWFIGKGSPQNGMPPCNLPEADKWQIVTFIKSLDEAHAAAPQAVASSEGPNTAPPPRAPFTDYRYEHPGQRHKISVADLPGPMPETSVGNAPENVPRPQGAWPKVPAGFKAQLYASGLRTPRIIHTAPNGDVFVAESDGGRIRVFRGLKADGTPEQSEVFASGLNRPYGIAFYPQGKEPRWVYVGNTDSIVRFPYTPGALKAGGEAQKIADVPAGRGHWTRDLAFSLDGKTLYVGVGSGSNVDDPDTHAAERERADILAMNPDGTNRRVYAYGIRNPSGIAVQPETGELWCSVNERDGLGDNLVPDYISHVQEHGFYGWPWWYMGDHQDPRHPGKHPELKEKAIVPDVLLQPHHASLGMAFYEGKQFPAEYRGDIFASQHGSWNRSVRTGYELIRVHLDKSGKATRGYEDFMTGFVVDAGHVWGRPVGVTVASDGSLLVTDDGSNSIWRVTRD